MYNPYVKRLLDFVLSFLGIVMLSPIILVLVLILIVVNSGKPFFFQLRPGKNGRLFKIIKFKTMSDLRSEDKGDVHNVSRITKAGAFIRKYSLDEILQLINVLKGDMSLIGPRPLLVEYLPLYNETQKKRHDVRPGITGWAQVKGRNTISWSQKFEYDVWYVENLSFILDIKILFLTIKKVIKKEGVNIDQNTIMPAWKGNN
ncbi:lipopolysaccharide/colanic/teichoic acid biosynthesis glycosyltransferase [Aquimarina sp. EL_43]|uniref:sugar transferase n=1 Tax=unclassified Aquimarina TaxID=2627091 RepID=UPI0018C94EBC|nr:MULTISPECIES: sugar transferase [unclassified Aquimarina]MBG6129910.1 lipopolysaccharide/colanic/teichoic acid biosynthesis glycosyltransferase [Aquimarina sp. EL_35]MBG6150975.1 lipopolysaccharide/colanic/teichoic acid biosynthesis glycosyltransferase [Aquimarina sp. EL_32]MBG6167718.1 lipopolysaccharide/colanic/teichoic acid biosynthesis glycosyltransferase [Aquimarina sp. EL_43]